MTQPIRSSDTFDDFDGIEDLNRAWDVWNADSSDRASAESELADFFAELEIVDDPPSPDPAFLATLRADLMKPLPTPSVTPIRQSSLGLVASPTMSAPFPRVTPLRLALVGIAAALLVAALFGGNRWLPGTGTAVMVASAMASPSSYEEPTATVYPDTSARSDQSDLVGQGSKQLVTFPTTIPSSSEKATFDDNLLAVVRTPAIVYSRE